MNWNELVREYGWTSGPLTALLWTLWGLRPRRRPAKTETDVGEVGQKVLRMMRRHGWRINSGGNANLGRLTVNAEGDVFLRFEPADVERVKLEPWEHALVAAEYKVLRKHVEEATVKAVEKVIQEL